MPQAMTAPRTGQTAPQRPLPLAPAAGASATGLPPAGSRIARGLAAFGDWLGRHRGAIQAVQWGMIAAYILLVAVPAFLPLPPGSAHIWSNLVLFAQFAFWGLWWPFVLLSMVLVGRSWCGIFCPEGALSEFASRRSLGRAVPRWLSWRGWPFVAFAGTTIYGQMVSVYQYPRPALLILGGSTLAAIAVGLVYGRDKRVWCRYLCPVNGVFALLAKLAPVSFQVNTAAWDASRRAGIAPGTVSCAPLVPIRTMRGASACHMCGRCSGFRGAVQLAPRAPNHEIVAVAGERANPWETALILFGLMGLAAGAFAWSASPWYVEAKQFLAERLIDAGVLWPLERSAPWWLLTNYPARNDTMTLLDGGMLLAYIGATGLTIGLAGSALLALGLGAGRAWSWARFHHLAQALIPLAGAGVFLGLSATTVSLLRGEGLDVPGLLGIRAMLLAGATLWSVWLGWRIAGGFARGARRGAVTLGVAGACGVSVLSWVMLFWVW